MSLNSTAQRWYNVALAGYFGLFLLLMFWNTVLMPSARFPVALVLMIWVTPLLLPLTGLLRGNKKSCSWAAYLSLIYLIHGISEAYAVPAERLYASLEIIFSLLLFTGCTFYIRSAAKQSR